MATSKEKTSKAAVFASGGSTKMFAKSGSTQSEAGVSGHTKLASFDKNPAKGGPALSADGNQGHASPAVSGQVSVSGSTGSNTFGVSGGKTKMFGKQTSARAQIGTTSKING